MYIKCTHVQVKLGNLNKIVELYPCQSITWLLYNIGQGVQEITLYCLLKLLVNSLSLKNKLP